MWNDLSSHSRSMTSLPRQPVSSSESSIGTVWSWRPCTTSAGVRIAGRSARTVSIRSSSCLERRDRERAQARVLVAQLWSEMSEPASLGTHARRDARESRSAAAPARGCPPPGSGAGAAASTSRPAPTTRSGYSRARRSASRPPIEKPQMATGRAADARRAGSSSAASAERSQSRQLLAARSRQRAAVAGQHAARSTVQPRAPQRLGERPDLERRAGDAVQAEHAAASPAIDSGDLSPLPGAEPPGHAEHPQRGVYAGLRRATGSRRGSPASRTPGMHSAQRRWRSGWRRGRAGHRG